jgi:hypothetical protein
MFRGLLQARLPSAHHSSDHPKSPGLEVCYSYRSDSIGSRLAAL